MQFKLPPMQLFRTVECSGDVCDLIGAQPNRLVFRVQPNEGIELSFSSKRPGMQYQIHPVRMDFDYSEAFPTKLPEAYERLLLDVMRGDRTLFTRDDELEAAWRFLDPVLNAWAEPAHTPHDYPAMSWGPDAAEALLGDDARQWRRGIIYQPDAQASAVGAAGGPHCGSDDARPTLARRAGILRRWPRRILTRLPTF